MENPATMGIPNYETVMLPLLKLTADQKEHAFPDLVETLAANFKLSEGERRELLPSGGQFVFDNRVSWARTYMKKAGLVAAPKRGVVQITERGLDFLKTRPAKLDGKVRRQFPEFRVFQKPREREMEQAGVPAGDPAAQLDPQENVELLFQRIGGEVSAELMERIKKCSPRFFEKLVVDLLVKMGYGGSIRDAGQVIGKSGDGGLDGMIKQDKLGLDAVYIQAKRWTDNQVGSKEIQAFVGALHGKRANKGVFITTAGFSKAAREYVGQIASKIVLIDGVELANLLIEYEVGVLTGRSFALKKIDAGYFSEE